MSTGESCSFTHAILRSPGQSVVDGLRTEDQGVPEHDLVLAEHAAYAAVLGDCGLKIDVLPALEAFPDSVFVEDTALVFPEGAILLRPGAPSRAGETPLIAPELRKQFPRVLEIEAGFADGGDVLRTEREVLIGLSSRTDALGARALVAQLERLGYRGRMVETPEGVLHFKSDCAMLDADTVLSTDRLAASGPFEGLRVVTVPSGEEPAANALRINCHVLLSDGFPRTHDLLVEEGYEVITLGTNQIALLDAGLSCMSLRW